MLRHPIRVAISHKGSRFLFQGSFRQTSAATKVEVRSQNFAPAVSNSPQQSTRLQNFGSKPPNRSRSGPALAPRPVKNSEGSRTHLNSAGDKLARLELREFLSSFARASPSEHDAAMAARFRDVIKNGVLSSRDIEECLIEIGGTSPQSAGRLAHFLFHACAVNLRRYTASTRPQTPAYAPRISFMYERVRAFLEIATNPGAPPPLDDLCALDRLS